MPNQPPIAVWLNSYEQSLKPALDSAARDGFGLIQINAAAERELQDFSRTAQRHFAHHLQSLGMEVDALAAAHGGLGLADRDKGDDRIIDLRRTLELCAALHIPRATVNIAGFSDETTRPLADESLRIAAELASNFGVTLAVQTSTADIPALADHLHRLRCPNLGLAVDSVQSVADDLRDKLHGHVHAAYVRDARKLGQQFEEADYGRGDVDFAGFLGRLADWEYRRPLTLRRSGLAGSVDALRRGREYFQSLLGISG
ncbi:MAG: sugar phosphate isomerase/epimerase family protein [Phycisphaerae bacterium]